MRYLAPALALLLLFAAPAPVFSQPYGAREGVRSGQVRSLGEILNAIRRERPGALADVQGPSIGPYGEPHYRIKWLTPDGRVLWLDTNARTGQVLGVEGDGPPIRPAPPRRNFDRRFAAPPPPPPNFEEGPRGPAGGFGRGTGYRGPPDFNRGPGRGPQRGARGVGRFGR